MNPIAISVTGRLGDDPRKFVTRDGTVGVELRLALDLPARVPGGDGVTRWVKVWAASRFPDRHFLSYFMLLPDCSGTGPAPLAGSGIQVLSGDGSDYSGSRCTVQCPPGPSAVSGT